MIKGWFRKISLCVKSLLELTTLQAGSGYWPFVSSLLCLQKLESPDSSFILWIHTEYGQGDTGAEDKNLGGRVELFSFSLFSGLSGGNSLLLCWYILSPGLISLFNWHYSLCFPCIFNSDIMLAAFASPLEKAPEMVSSIPLTPPQKKSVLLNCSVELLSILTVLCTNLLMLAEVSILVNFELRIEIFA